MSLWHLWMTLINRHLFINTNSRQGNFSFYMSSWPLKLQASLTAVQVLALTSEQEFTALFKELKTQSPEIFDEAYKRVNKTLPKEQIQLQVEKYITEQKADAFFEQFLVQCVLVQDDFVKRHPFRLNMMRNDFRQYFEHQVGLLAAVFDFYIQEYASSLPIPPKYKNLCLHVDAIQGMLRGLNVFSSESGLNKHNLKQIISVVQFQGKSEDRNYVTKPSDLGNTPSKQTVRGITPTTENQRQGLDMSSAISANYCIVFYEFIELLYLVAQYFNPDPFTNCNQKFALFMEKVLVVNMKFKIKNKSIVESTQKTNLIRYLSNTKIQRQFQGLDCNRLPE